LALLGLDSCLAKLGSSDAAAVLRVAHQHLAALGARPAAAEADALLRSTLLESS
jgi:hypothetical protein